MGRLFWGEVYSGEKCCKIQVNWSKWVFFGLCFVFRCVQHECAVNFKGETDYINLWIQPSRSNLVGRIKMDPHMSQCQQIMYKNMIERNEKDQMVSLNAHSMCGMVSRWSYCLYSEHITFFLGWINTNCPAWIASICPFALCLNNHLDKLSSQLLDHLIYC